ncbi:hypothetical protein [Psychromonas aquimarina]|uniref:hypothetical protein n=1 Tax=Psychromonas aquimarina TaxID=444919 RepID=UPI00048EDAC3|nr:hypothetical protein [Psychromonas aquimarina]
MRRLKTLRQVQDGLVMVRLLLMQGLEQKVFMISIKQAATGRNQRPLKQPLLVVQPLQEYLLAVW